MTSKAAKRRKRRGGRPRVEGVEREANGKPSRRASVRREREAMTEAEAKSVAIEARVRHTGLSRELADAPMASTIHGTMRLLGMEAERRKKPLGPGMLTADQWEAADWYLGRRAMWLRTIDAPGRQVEEQRNLPPELVGLSAEEYQQKLREWTDRVKAEWASVLACLQQASIEHRSPIISAFDLILVRNEPMPHMEGDLRIGLNAIHRRFIAAERKAA